MPEVKWASGTDWSSGIWRFTGEYSGKYMPDFVPSLVDPVIGTEPDYSKPADGITITAGAEFYSGRSGSLYDIVDGFMNSIYVALKADF